MLASLGLWVTTLVFDSISEMALADRLHVVNVIVGDLDVEGVLELEHHVDEPGGVHLQVVQDVGLARSHCRAPPGS